MSTDSNFSQRISEARSKAEQEAKNEYYKKYVENGAEFIRNKTGIHDAKDLIIWFRDANEGAGLPPGFNPEAHKNFPYDDPIYGRVKWILRYII